MSLHGLRLRILLSALGLTLAGCGPEYPIEYETKHLRIAKTFDAPICAGTLRAMELDAARIAEQLDGHAYLPVDVVLGVGAVAEHCPAGSSGCSAGGGPVYTEFRSVGHELVHAFAGERGHIPFVEEGLAEALGGGLSTVHWLEVDTSGVSLTEAFVGQTTSDDAAYIVAGHFVAWLIDRRGVDLFMTFRAASRNHTKISEIAAAFEAIYGMSLEAAELSWKSTAPSSYKIGQGDCEGPSEAWVDDLRWEHRLEADCDAETTFGPLGDSVAVEAGMRRTVLVDVLRSGSYQFSANATRAGTLEIDSYACGCSLGPETRESHAIQTGSQSVEVTLWPCRYRISYIVTGVDDAAVNVGLEFVGT